MTEERAKRLSALLRSLSEDVLNNNIRIRFSDFTHDFNSNEYGLSLTYIPLDDADCIKQNGPE